MSEKITKKLKKNPKSSDTKQDKDDSSSQLKKDVKIIKVEKMEILEERKKKKIVEQEETKASNEEKNEQQQYKDTPSSTPVDLKKYGENEPLGKDFFTQDVVTLARELLGKVLVRQTKDGVIKALIVETEAYKAPLDKACHAYNNKKTERTKNFWLEGGHVYMYSIYGNNFCFNVVAGREGEPEAVLVRAVEPIEGIDIVMKNRQVKNKKPKELTGGPSKLTKAMNIDMSHNGHDLRKKGELYICKGNYANFQIQVTKRININYAEEWKDKMWRFIIQDNKYVSV